MSTMTVECNQQAPGKGVVGGGVEARKRRHTTSLSPTSLGGERRGEARSEKKARRD
jgi:hypothetical protein